MIYHKQNKTEVSKYNTEKLQNDELNFIGKDIWILHATVHS
jgi:hypothetical protein